MLTERMIRNAKENGRTYTRWDGKLRRLGLQVTRGGRRNFVIRYKSGDRWRQAILGRCEEMTLKQARERAADELLRIRAGEKDPLERRRQSREAPTVTDGINRFFDDFAPKRVELGRMSPNTVRDYRNQARKYITPCLGNRKAADVTRWHVEKMVRDLPNIQRNRVLALASRLFNLFEIWEWRPQNTNPCRGVERAREQARDRVLSGREMATLADAFAEANERHPGPVAAFRIAALTGLRIGEILAMRWEHIDFETQTLTLPETKTGRRNHDLPAPALTVIAALPKINAWVCTSGRGPLGYSHARMVFADLVKRAGLVDVRIHDLRRTVMTNAARSGVGTHVLRDLLGHKTATMADRYIRALGNPVRDARAAVGDLMAAQMAGEQGEVKQFAKGG